MQQVMTDDPAEFFAPTSSDAIDALLGKYAYARKHIEAVGEFMNGPDMLAAASYFFDAQRDRFGRFVSSPGDIFETAPALAALDATYWQQALNLTDVMDYMPAAKRQAWFDQIKAHETPPFEEQTVRATLSSLLSQRMDFLSEMVEGIFRGLSGEHVTNRPEGFSKRMIIHHVVNGYFRTTERNAELIHDLRCVVAKFMHRDQPHHNATRHAIQQMTYTPGEWHWLDGCALRCRVYKKGTAHLEVHPDIAWRLNQILAHRHPHAIPSQHRQPPKKSKPSKVFNLLHKPLPFAVLKQIDAGRYWGRAQGSHKANTLHLGMEWSRSDKHLKRAVTEVLESIGGVASDCAFQFDYDAEPVINEILTSGMVPDHKSHQFYPTPERLGRIAIELAEIEPHHRCLEPSAGTGALAALIEPRRHNGYDRILCVEVSRLHAGILTAKGFECVVQSDFLEWAPGYDGEAFDRVIMNPPFSEGRWQAHTTAAAQLLTPGGQLVAILPATAANSFTLPSAHCEWHGPYTNEFAGTGVSVVILKATCKDKK